MKLLRHRLHRALRAPRARRGLRLVRAGLVAGLASGALVLGLARYPELARVQAVEISGNTHASEAAVRHLAGVHLGDPLLLIDIGAVVQGVARHPWVDEVTVTRALPGVLRVEVVEHEDVLLMVHDGGLYRVNRRGEVFVRARGHDLDLPVLTGVPDALVDDHPAVARRVLHDALALLDAVEASEVLTVDALSELHFDAALGYSLRLRNGGEVLLGFRAVKPQLRRLEAMVSSGLDLDVPTRVDLDLDGLAVATPLRT